MRTEQVRDLWSGMRFGRFFTVGALGAALDMTALAVLVESTGLDPLLGKVVAAETAIIVMFVVNERWTFTGFGRSAPTFVARRLLKSNLVRAGGATTALTTLYLLHSVLGFWYLVSNAAGIGLGFFINYVFESLYTWRVTG